jgi:cytochrome d ubiquinol oxidase subunit I
MPAILATALGSVQQRYLLEARQMQALSFAVHIPLVCFGIAFPAMVLFVEWLYSRSGDEVYLCLARRWTRVTVALFAVGVITGTILSFEMGLLWPNFTATFGGVFGLGFAIEGFSFFAEAIFIGIYVYGWSRLSRRAHLVSGIPVVIAGFTGSLMVIAVDAWMNHPGGFRMRNGQVTDIHPLRALFGNPYPWHELVHMYIAGYIVTGFLVAAAYAFGRMRGRWGRYERTALAVPLTIAAVASPIQVLVGDWAGRDVATYQPTKLAALEGVGHTVRGAPEHLLGWYTDGKVKYGIGIPHALSLLARHSWNGTIPGLDTVPAADRPPVNVVRFAFQIMVGIGTLLAFLGLVYLFVRWRRRMRPAAEAFPESKWFYRAVVVAGPLSFVALVSGWVTTEVGRQPWVVYGTMRTSQAVTGAGGDPGRVRDACGGVHRRGDGRGLGAAPARGRAAQRGRRGGLIVLYTIPLVFVLVGLALYGVLGGADFGAGFWQLVSGSDERSRRIRELAHDSMAPVWEANHVWLIFVLTVTWTCYPKFFGSAASTLCVALSIAAVGIVFRGAAYALRTGTSARHEQRLFDSVLGGSSVLAPFALGAAIGGIAAGRVPVGNAAGNLFSSWLNPVSILIGVLAVATGAYLAAVFLCGDAMRRSEPELAEAFRSARSVPAWSPERLPSAALSSCTPTLIRSITASSRATVWRL